MKHAIPTDALLTLSGVHTHIGAYHILHGVDLVVARGQLTMLLGRNGAGKTTTLRTIMGLWHASQGKVVFDGKAITAAETPDIAGLDIAYVPENMGIFSDLTVKENMLLAARSATNRWRSERHSDVHIRFKKMSRSNSRPSSNFFLVAASTASTHLAGAGKFLAMPLTMLRANWK